jgi:hypothetical protein
MNSVPSSPTQGPGWAKAPMGAGKSPAGYLVLARPTPASPGLRISPSRIITGTSRVAGGGEEPRHRCHFQVLNNYKKHGPKRTF